MQSFLEPLVITLCNPITAGTVMKRFDSTKLFKLACQDVVERFHLLISLMFVLVSIVCLACNITNVRSLVTLQAAFFG